MRIDRIDVLSFEYPRLRIEVRCGKGTYIRSLARDLGDRLNCGGYVGDLRRMHVGSFSAEAAVPLDADAETARSRLLPPAAAVAELPHVTLPPDALAKVRHGHTVGAPVASDGEIALFDTDGALVGVAAADRAAQTLRPLKVFPA